MSGVDPGSQPPPPPPQPTPAPPPGPPKRWSCQPFGCTCQGMADYYGVYHLRTIHSFILMIRELWIG
jgi:hypothetical protein|eukprot:COSAG01_NODE_2970_length_6775_cov_8.832235_6_plen_67_part_00